MGNIFPSLGHAEQYITSYITQPLRNLVTPNPSPQPPPPPPPSQPTAPPASKSAGNKSQSTEVEMRPLHNTAAAAAGDETDRHRIAHSRDSRALQRATLARIETEAATHLGTQGVLDDAEGEGSEQHNRHVHLDTAPPDPRFVGHPDQSQYCWALYNSYLKCVDGRSVLDEHCLFLKKCAVAMCPCDLIADWTAERKAGRWYGVPVPYHKGEMDLGELEEELEVEDEEEKKEVQEAKQAEQVEHEQLNTDDDHTRQREDASKQEPQQAESTTQTPAQHVKKIEERLVEPTEPEEDVTQSAVPVTARDQEEAVSVMDSAEPVQEREAEVVSEVESEQQSGLGGVGSEAGVDPLPEGVDDLYERQRREALRLWEEQQQGQRERERAKREEEEATNKRHRLDMKELVRHAMTAIHK